jgi:hypothetical protein
MNIEAVRRVLLWCTVINYGILLVWFLLFSCCEEHKKAGGSLTMSDNVLKIRRRKNIKS